MKIRQSLGRVGVIGDVHAEDDHLAIALDWFGGQNVDAVLCTGDVADGTGDIDRCCALLEGARVRTVRGNHDRWLLADRVRGVPDAHRFEDLGQKARHYLSALPKSLEFETPMGPLLLCHGVADNDLRKVWPGTARMGPERSEELDALLRENRLRFVINGHSHYRVLVDFPGLVLINAGTLVSRHRPGISVIDFNQGVIIAHEFEGDRLGELVAEHPLDPGTERRIWADTQEFDGNWQAVALYGPPLP